MACWGVLWAWTSGFLPCSSAELGFGPRQCKGALKGAPRLVWLFIYCVNFLLPATEISPSFLDTQLLPFLKRTCLKAALFPVVIDAGSHECGICRLPQAEGLWVAFPWLLLNLPMMFGELVWAFCPDSYLFPRAWPNGILTTEVWSSGRREVRDVSPRSESRTFGKF